MLNPNLLRNDVNLSLVAEKLARRNFVLDINNLKNREKKRKILQIELERLQSIRKIQSKKIGIAKARGESVQLLCQEVNVVINRLNEVKHTMRLLQDEIHEYVLSIPNLPDDSTPEKDNVQIFIQEYPRKDAFLIRDHVELGKLIGGLDFISGAQISGSRFVVIRGQIARLHRALSQFMLNVHITEHGYQEYYVPYLVNQKSLYGTGQLPKFFNDLFHVQSDMNGENSVNLYTLIPTAEVPLINLVRNKIINEKDLPIKMVAHSPCFRFEAGTYGRENRGLIRTHQFDKVEIVQIVKPEFSMQALEEITGHAEKILQLLNLSYRKVLLCANNIGFSACKTYDLDVWLPGRSIYCEVSSCSNIGDFQARRMCTRYRMEKDRKICLVHTLNASGLAVGRTLAAILENYQLPDGRIEIPAVLHSYMNGLTHIDGCFDVL